ncbi:unnamed protein product [Cladocopium goreaui]|uniref:E3 ubiquitin-protein ligase HERC1 n=1 Tax=Cladocopium goreaui TaxID=2562237 RepID=A0A9P1BNE5_9DINO|nr:unnamed protein product [Cladocopium goreaui]
MARTPSSFYAEIDRYEIVEEPADPENPLAKGMEVLKARIPLMGQGSHAEYNIRVQNEGKYHIVRRRFAEFVTLHDFLKRQFGPVLMLELPKKTPIRYFNQDKLEDRKNALNVYLKDLCKRKEIVDLVEVQRFFGCQVRPGSVPTGYAPQAQAPQVQQPAPVVSCQGLQMVPPCSAQLSPAPDTSAELRLSGQRLASLWFTVTRRMNWPGGTHEVEF